MATTENDRLTTEPPIAPTKPASPQKQRRVSSKKLYRTLWRWHLYAGILVWPMLIWSSITGAIYIFVDEVEPLMHPDKMVVEPREERISLQQQADAAQTTFPEAPLAFLHIPGRPDRSTKFALMSKEQGTLYVFVNPYSGEVLGSLIHNEMFFPIVRRLHRNFYADFWGRIIIELGTSWGIFMLLSGMFLWWPRSKSKGASGVWLPRWRGSGSQLLRDLHAITAMYLVPIILAILVTGLLYSQVWGKTFFYIAKSTDALPRFSVESTVPDKNSESLSLDQVAAVAKEQGLTEEEYQILLPFDFGKGEIDPKKTFALRGHKSLVTEQQLLFIDQYSGKIVNQTDWQKMTMMSQYITLAYPVHVGSIFGMPTKILALIACLVIVLSCITGIIMWWRTRPQGGLKLPQRTDAEILPWWLIITLILLSIFLPVVGLSILILPLIDWLIIKPIWYIKRRFV
ncbi:Hypothetical protein PBC10988_18760 [Planctomycetales bacterium 10988]|nr:Hypothetical protein PBC10988_18760 [Planctomycetales bacterium 10988]